MSEPTAVKRPISALESNLVRQLANQLAAEGIGCSVEAAAAAIATLAAAGRVSFHSDSLTARIEVGGRTLVEARRDWLQFRAALDDRGAVL